MERYRGLTEALLKHRGMAGFCYTQLTDVEQEVNGLYTYGPPSQIRSGGYPGHHFAEGGYRGAGDIPSRQNSGRTLDGKGKPAIICSIPVWRRI